MCFSDFKSKDDINCKARPMKIKPLSKGCEWNNLSEWVVSSDSVQSSKKNNDAFFTKSGLFWG